MEECDSISHIISVLDELIKKHRDGIISCIDDPIWKEQRYYSNMIYYSPRLRAGIHTNQQLEPTFFDDLYFSIIKAYISITGYTPPPWFRKNRAWLDVLQKKLGDTDEIKKEALISLFLKCTAFCANDSIKDAGDIAMLREYHILKGEK